MVAISFSERRFVDLIRQGKKDQTIRPYNKKRFEEIKRIKKLQLYYKQRTKECFKIADAELVNIFRIKFLGFPNILIYKKGDIVETENMVYSTFDEWQSLDLAEVKQIAKRDGFRDIVEFFDWFEGRYGDMLRDMVFMIIRWKLKEGD